MIKDVKNNDEQVVIPVSAKKKNHRKNETEDVVFASSNATRILEDEVMQVQEEIEEFISPSVVVSAEETSTTAPPTNSPRKRGRPRKNSEVASEVVNSYAATPKKRGRPAFNRDWMMADTIAALRDTKGNDIFVTRKDLQSLVENGTIPVSYALAFTKICATPVRGLFILPREWRNEWVGYQEALEDFLNSLR